MYHRFSAVAGSWQVLFIGLLLWGVLCLTGWMIFTSGGGPIGGTGVPVFIDSGSTTAYLDSTGTTWSADGDVTGGVYATSTTTVTNTADPALFQTFRTAPTGNIVYAVPIAGGGLFQVSELEAELDATVAKGSRIQNIILACDGTQIAAHNNFDILDPLGPCGGNTKVGRACTITDWVQCGSAGDSTNHTISITFNAIANQAQVNAIRIIPNAQAIIATVTPSPTATPPPLNALGPQIISGAGAVGTGDLQLTVNLSPGEGLVLLHRGSTTGTVTDPGVSDSLGNTWTLDTGQSGESVNGPSSGCLNVDYVTSPIGKGTGGSDVITAKSPGSGLPNLAIAYELNDFGGIDTANGVGITPYTTTVSASSVTPQLTLDTLLGIFDVEVPSGGPTPAFSGSPFNSVGAGTPQDVALLGTPFNSTLLVGAPSEQGVFQNTVVIQQGAAPAGNFCGGLTALEPVVAFVGRSQGFVPVAGGPVMAANDFLNTMGVNTHDIQGFNNPPQMQSYLEYLGVRLIRDDATGCLQNNSTPTGCSGASPNGGSVQDLINVHNGTKNVTVGTVITNSGGFTVGASNPTGIMVSELAFFGCGVNVCGNPSPDQNMRLTSAMWDYLAQGGAMLQAEGANEPFNFGFVYNGLGCNNSSYQGCEWAMSDLNQLLTGGTTTVGGVHDTILSGFNFKLGGLSLVGDEPDNSCLQYPTIPNPNNTGCNNVVPAGTKFADIENIHPYLDVGNPVYDNMINDAYANYDNGTGFGSEHTNPNQIHFFDNPDGQYCHQTWIKGFPAIPLGAQCDAIPREITETGWHSNTVSNTQYGKIVINAFLTAAAAHYKYFFWFMMADEDDFPNSGILGSADQGQSSNQQPLIHIKTSGIYLHNLTSILSDITSNFTTTAANITTSALPATVHSLLLEKSNFQYEYVIWDDRPEGEGTDNVTVTLPQSYSMVNVYDPTSGIAPTSTLHNVSSVQLTLSDHPMIVEFNLGSAIPSLGPSPTPIQPSPTPTPPPPGPGATPVPGAPTISDYAQTDTQANTTSTVVFPTMTPANGSTLVFIATEAFNPVANFTLTDSQNNAIPVLLPATVVNTNLFNCGSQAPCADVLEVFCKNALNETGGGYTLNWSGGPNGLGYVQNSFIVLQGTTCQKVDGSIKTVTTQGTSGTIPAVMTTAADIVLWATAAVGGTSVVNVTLSNGYSYDLLSPNPGFNSVTAADWLPTNTLGPTVTATDTVPYGLVGVQIPFHS